MRFVASGSLGDKAQRAAFEANRTSIATQRDDKQPIRCSEAR
jgi:hypothetical protein